MDRDNLGVLEGDLTLRFGWTHVVAQPCETAAQVARLLSARGWDGIAERCSSCQAVPGGLGCEP